MKTMIDKSSSRGYFDHGWLKTHHSFSFADYYNPQRVNFGALRVLNDDWIAPSEGFGKHPHKNMEIVTIPLKGFLKHGDSIQNMETITPGSIQVMSAGSGIWHSEFNGSDTEPSELLQIWVMPHQQNTAPHYKSYDIRPLLKQNKLALFLSPDGETEASLLQNAWFSMGSFDTGQTADYKLHKEKTGVYLFVIEGEVKAGGTTLARRDGMGIQEIKELSIEVVKDSTLLLMEVSMEV